MNIVWFRRNLRLDDNLPLQKAIDQGKPVLPIFIFDANILARFPNPQDRRVNFLAAALFEMHKKLRSLGGSMNILFGDPKTLIPQLISLLQAKGIQVENVYADEDFEPSNIERDRNVEQNISCNLNLICDHLLLRPGTILTGQKQAFKVFTPFSNAFKIHVSNTKVRQVTCDIANTKFYSLKAKDAEIKIVNTESVETILNDIGYQFKADELWKVQDVDTKFTDFIKHKLSEYKTARDFMPELGTSQLSPFIRFGLISIRKCFLQAYDQPNSQMWINELLWREFYANILFHFPHTVNTELISHYVNQIPWKQDKHLLSLLESGRTGFPIVDAAMRQLTQDGWMHNRSRMIVASFASKNLLLDWRLGEELFAKYLMDYDLSSNVGGWQWSSSCGTDAQPYFRIFNPMLQSAKFDPEGKYIKKYLPELASVAPAHIHENDLIAKLYPELQYPKPIVDYKISREIALKAFDPKTY
jgi:deoxyribodipyrimidine photo-lyase